MNWFIEVIKKYAVFGGRARRKEYWMFALFYIVFYFGLILIEKMAGIEPIGEDRMDGGALALCYQLALAIPYLAVSVRRMHDTDRRGWWILVPIANLVFACTEGTRSSNRFGSDPKALAA